MVAVGILIICFIFRLVGCYLGFSTRSSVGHNCWRFTYFVHSHKLMYCFWNDMCICKTSKVIGTVLPVIRPPCCMILDVWRTSTSHETGSTTIVKFDAEIGGVGATLRGGCFLALRGWTPLLSLGTHYEFITSENFLPAGLVFKSFVNDTKHWNVLLL